MFDKRQALRRSAAMIGLSIAAFLAGCEPRSPSPDESQPTDRNPVPGSPQTATADPRSNASVQPSVPGTPAAPVVPPSSARVSGASPGVASGGMARADLEPVGSSMARGVVEFAPDASGMMAIHVQVSGLEPGEHGFHVHELGDCSALDGSSAGDHLAPEKDMHGAPDSAHDAHHAGDLGNVTADATGNAELTIRDDELALEGDHGVVGRAVVVHVDPDDLMTQPSGNTGNPAACGVVMAVTHSPPYDVDREVNR
jgi:Cu-Zn family superoxide dismutase